MLRILSIQNFHRWSWACIVNQLRKLWRTRYTINHIIRERREAISEAEKDVDIILVQNVDSIKLVAADMRPKAVVRIGGIGMDNDKLLENCHKYDTLLASVGAVVGTSAALTKVGARNNPNSHTIPNGTDLTMFAPDATRWEKRKKRDKFVVGFAGNIAISRYMLYKGYPQIVAACNELVLDVDLKLALYGPSQLPHECMVKDFYSQIDCLVNASQGEGCSNTIMEALACGVPVLLTKVGYHGECLLNTYSCLFIEQTMESIVAQINYLRNSICLQKRLSRNGRAFAELNHDITDIAANYADIFQRIYEANKTKEQL